MKTMKTISKIQKEIKEKTTVTTKKISRKESFVYRQAIKIMPFVSSIELKDILKIIKNTEFRLVYSHRGLIIYKIR